MDVSVIIPTYNRSGYLRECIESALRQKGIDVEIIVVDDGSTDDTVEVAASFGDRIRYEHQENAGACSARNRGLGMARGGFVKFLDADDWLEPDSLADQVKTLETTGAEVSYGLWKEVGGATAAEAPPSETMPCDDPVDALLADWWCVPCAYLIRRETALRARWDPSLTSAQDFDYMLRVAMTGARFVHTPRLVGYYRQHDEARVSRRNLDVWISNRERVLQKAEQALRESGGLTSSRSHWLALAYFRLAQSAYSTDRARFRELLARARNAQPSFRPPRRFHAWMATVVGFEGAEALLEVRRRWRRS